MLLVKLLKKSALYSKATSLLPTAGNIYYIHTCSSYRILLTIINYPTHLRVANYYDLQVFVRHAKNRCIFIHKNILIVIHNGLNENTNFVQK